MHALASKTGWMCAAWCAYSRECVWIGKDKETQRAAAPSITNAACNLAVVSKRKSVAIIGEEDVDVATDGKE